MSLKRLYMVVWPKCRVLIQVIFGVCASGIAFAVVCGWYLMWFLPDVSMHSNIRDVDLLLRLLELRTDSPADPFWFLRTEDPIVQALAPSSDKSRQGIGPPASALAVSVAELEAAHQSVSQLFQLSLPSDEDASTILEQKMVIRSELNRWGEGLIGLARYRAATNKESKVIREEFQPTTEAERFWAVWKTLCAGFDQASADLPRLPLLAKEAYPDPADFASAVAWARTYYGRLQSKHRAFREAWLARGAPETAPKFPGEVGFVIVQTALPPETDWTLYWVLYQHVGFGEESHAAVYRRWLAHFPPNRRGEVLDWGRKLEAERRLAGEPLPPTSDNVAVMCVIERLIGTDAYGEAARKAVAQAIPADKRIDLAFSITNFYPIDDFVLLAVSGDPLSLTIIGSKGTGFLFLLGALLFFALALRVAILMVLGEWVLRLRADQEYQAYRHGRGRRGWLRWLFASCVVSGVYTIYSWATLSPELYIFISSIWEIFLGSLVMVLLGGSAITAISRTVAVIMIFYSIRITRTWWDEILGIALGGYILFHFGNGLIAIALFASSELFTAFLLHRHPDEQKPAEAPKLVPLKA